MTTAAITFDTLAYSKKLKKAGVPDKQAEAQTEIMAEMMTETIAKQFATKHDLHREITALKAELKQDIANVRQEIAHLTFRTGAMMAGSVVTMLTLLPIIMKLVNQI